MRGPVSLTFLELSKIISWKNTMPEITFMVRISSWNFVRVPKAWLWCTRFQHEILIKSMISAIHKFQENILESLQNVSEAPHRPLEMIAGNWKQRLLPPPVGMMRIQSFLDSVAFIVWSCNGRNLEMPNTDLARLTSFSDHVKSGRKGSNISGVQSVQDSGNSTANPLELLQSCTLKPLV